MNRPPYVRILPPPERRQPRRKWPGDLKVAVVAGAATFAMLKGYDAVSADQSANTVSKDAIVSNNNTTPIDVIEPNTPPPADTVKPPKNNEPTAEDSTSKDLFRMSVATLNIHTAGGTSGEPRMRKTDTFVNTQLHNPDLLFMQEVESRPHYKTVKEYLHDDYSFYPAVLENINRNTMQSRLIAYDPDEFEVLKKDELTHKRYEWKDWPQPSHVPVLILLHKDTGRTVIAINLHYSAYKDGAEERMQAAEAVEDKLKELQEDYPDALFVVGGDLNERGVVVDSGPGKTYQLDADNLSCKIWADYVQHGAQAEKGTGRACPEPGKSAVDQLSLSWDVAEKVDYRHILAGERAGTDHRYAVLLETALTAIND